VSALSPQVFTEVGEPIWWLASSRTGCCSGSITCSGSTGTTAASTRPAVPDEVAQGEDARRSSAAARGVPVELHAARRRRDRGAAPRRRVPALRVSPTRRWTRRRGIIWQANCMDASRRRRSSSRSSRASRTCRSGATTTRTGTRTSRSRTRRRRSSPTSGGSNYRRRVAAALKIWLDDITGVRRANVYLPTASTSSRPADTIAIQEPTIQQKVEIPWAALEGRREVRRNPLGSSRSSRCATVRGCLVEGESEIADVIPIQNQINGFLFLLALAGYFGAHRQRWAVRDQDGRRRARRTRGAVRRRDRPADRLENPDTKFGEFGRPTSAGTSRRSSRRSAHRRHTRTPRHYLIEQGQSPSGDAIKSAESGLVKKVERSSGRSAKGSRRRSGSPAETALVEARLHADGHPPDPRAEGLQPGDVRGARACRRHSRARRAATRGRVTPQPTGWTTP
jgi:hypothetical protein